MANLIPKRRYQNLRNKTKNSLEIRAIGENAVEISGYVNAIERPSDVLFSKEHGGKFIERMMSGAFKKALSHNANGVALLLNHDANLNYGSTKRGNLKLEEDNIGLRVNAIVEDEKFFKKAHNGELIGWSFGFFDRDVVEQRFEEWDLTTRKVYDLDLVEVSMLDRTKKPAYPGTQLNYRARDADGMQFRTWDIVPESVEFVGFEEQKNAERSKNAMNGNLEIRATPSNAEQPKQEEPTIRENALPTKEEIRDMVEKAVDEKKFDLECEAQKILSGAENRDLNNSEISRLNELKACIKNLDERLRKTETERLRDFFNKPNSSTKKVLKSASKLNSTLNKEERDFANFLRYNQRDGELVIGDAGALVPSTIANKIIKAVFDLSPILQRSTQYNVNGKLHLPCYDETDKQVTMAYTEDFKVVDPAIGEFKSIDLSNFLAGVLVLVGLQLVNNTEFPIVDFVVEQMAYTIHRFVEKELLNGTEGKVEGLSKLSNHITSAASNAITADEVIDLQSKVKDLYQENAIWIMHPETRQALRKLKDGVGRYLLETSYDITGSFGTTLLGKPVYTSDNMPKMAGGKTAIYYGDMHGLATKFSENININVLRERYAEKHAIGVIGFLEFDAKVQNSQQIAKLVMKG